ncbi:similar to Saccharomyces cerevisiae YJL089W SIP4 C6 zinc cluster transcriptional activator that binds to the carbon source-responsive element (CSRE) of gluconeogenic genes [Maudiozyma saulgeensis]|uniref:Similar to Saccharomyces cerevisiae YJL089W SIP4 C6 zinc cluster transcriptional activator that binds to the carbon source-responsive element (CSRE) of gluconeogenic genes n=1 Tax=Maudiozyma saulgeensis TaxID=1789683 RepID=A0A1X7R7W0_9SACH|nr:similar to Saccharomyces cerevisiae YJL089W SIP4 C6 zinc cluster transcriptional activator that binds to the carbon source-responsive element (CSRE) of gluconeogenic genes [Kazachstania saulgeensis]
MVGKMPISTSTIVPKNNNKKKQKNSTSSNNEMHLKNFRKTQACDRCRLKKVKCDGLKPSCSNCAKVNFECTRGDKLARRGIPKGYTESLEQEVVRLQQLLSSQQQTTKTFDHNLQNSKENNELALSFINDNFHKFENYSVKVDDNRQTFLGHRTWNKIFHIDNDILNTENETHKFDDFEPILMTLMKQQLKLNGNNYVFPQFLINQYRNDTYIIKSQLIQAVRQFFLSINSLIPILYPFDILETSLIDMIVTASQQTDQLEINTTKPPLLNLLILQYIIQMNWNCYDNMILYQLTKLILNANVSDINTVQCLNLTIYYFMGYCPTLNTPLQQAIVIDLINMNYSKCLSMALYINPKNLHEVPKGNIRHLKKQNINNDENDSIYNVTFWCFQFLSSWWSLIQGLPKVNFLIDEFQPKELKIPILKSFSLLVDLVVKSLDGTNLQLILESTERSKLVLTIENFRNQLTNYKLYHNYFDHDQNDQELLSNNISTNKQLMLEKSEFIEINLTLFYLVLTLIAELEPGKSLYKDNRNNINSKENNNNMASSKNLQGKNDSIEEVCYEILTLYYLLILHFNSLNNNSGNISHQPLKFNLFHFLPISNVDLINTCESILCDWSDRMSQMMVPGSDDVTNKKILKNQYYWKFNKFKQFLIKWSLLWYQSDIMTLEKQPFIKSFNIDLSIFKVNEHFQVATTPTMYLKQISDFNDSNFNLTYNNSLIRTNSKVIMEQFNMFTGSNNNNNNGAGTVSNSRNLSTLFKSLTTPKLEEINSNLFLPTATTNDTGTQAQQDFVINDPNQPNPLYLLSPLLVGSHEDTDDGYAEDDDEGSCDNMEPLEIPFKTKRRTASLFQHHQHQVAPPTQQQHNYVQNENTKPNQLNVKSLLSPIAAGSSTSLNADVGIDLPLNTSNTQKKRKIDQTGYLFYPRGEDENGILSQQQSPTLPLPRTNSILSSRVMPPPFPGTSITSISQLLIPSDGGNSQTNNNSTKNISGLPRLTEVETPKNFVNMLLLPSSLSASTTAVNEQESLKDGNDKKRK